MAVFNEPTKWAQTLGKDADVVAIPDTADETDPSIDKIFPSVFSVPLAQGGRAIPRSVLNGLFKLVGDWSFYQQNGGVPTYSADFDYVVGRVILYTDNNLYKCIQANGASSTVVAPDSVTPNNGLDYWQRLDSSNYIPNQIISSPVPLTDANLHLLDGSQLALSGVYAGYVAMMKALYESDPTLECFTDEATWQASVSSYGVCGRFVWDSVNETLRLPLITGFIEGTNTASELGSVVEAGAPNIRGSMANISSHFVSTDTSSDGALTYIHNSDGGGATAGFKNGTLFFDASKSNSIYGKSNTIQPQAVKVYNYICVGTVSKTQIQIDIDNVLTDLNGKADKDLSNSVSSWSDTVKIAMAHNAMPSGTSEALTVGASGTTYTAPADGYFEAGGSATANNQSLQLSSSTYINNKGANMQSGDYIRLYMPVSKGDIATLNYTCGGVGLTFIYANGSISEA